MCRRDGHDVLATLHVVKQKWRSVAHLQPTPLLEEVSSAIRMIETYFVSTSIEPAGRKVFDVYRNRKRDLLVLSTGSAIPPAYSANKWRRSRTRILNVSDEIKSTVQRQGYYVRSLRVANKGIT